MSRNFTDGHLWTLDFTTALQSAHLLAEHPAACRADLVLAVARGGLWPAAAIAARLRLPLVSVHAQHNSTEDVRLQAGNHVEVLPLEGVATDRRRGVIVDDICGTGATLSAVRTALPPALREAPAMTLCRNTGSWQVPEAWVWDVADWVCFPWEPRPKPHERTRPLRLPDHLMLPGRSR